MNKVEKFIYDAVKGNQYLKVRIRNIYQSFFDLLPNQPNYSLNPIHFREGYFFGFHDITPFSYDDSKILANKLTIPFRMPLPNDPLELGYFELKEGTFDNKFVPIGTSNAWNYHKGCRLQWLGTHGIIYNDSQEKKLISRTYNLETKEERTIPFPIDSVTKDGNFAATFNYARLERYMPGYGYAGHEEQDHFNELKAPEGTGLFLVNLKTNKRELLISLKELSQLGNFSSSLENAFHYVTHTLFSKDGRYLAFLHRWVDAFNTLNRHSRLLCLDMVGQKFHVAPVNDMVSHYVWNNNNQIVAYCRVGHQDGHVLFTEPTLQSFKRVAHNILNSDGHQSFINNQSFVTDTYPDRMRMANLFKVDIESNDVTKLARLKSFKEFQSKPMRHWACDLHPRMNNGGNVVCFDSVHTGKRALCLMNIE